MDTTCTEANRIFVVEDSSAIRDRLLDMFGEIGGVEVVGTAPDSDGAVAGILRTKADVVILDIGLARGTGIDVLRTVHPQCPEIVFIVITNMANPQYRRICLQAGASYFLDKSSEMHKVREIVAGLAGSTLTR